MNFLRRVFGMRWIDRVTNEVRNLCGMERILIREWRRMRLGGSEENMAG